LKWQWIREHGDADWLGKSLQMPIAALLYVLVDSVAAVGVFAAETGVISYDVGKEEGRQTSIS
jgi:hypothetical protein